MARKASKATIAQWLQSYHPWRESLSLRARKIHPDGALAVYRMADDVFDRICAGECTICTLALARSAVRVVEDFESGYYVGVTETGGFIVK